MNWESKLHSWCELARAQRAGVAPLSKPSTWAHYESWIEKGFHGDMEYLKQHQEKKKNPAGWKPSLKSALVFTFPYFPHPEGPAIFSASRTALYSQGRDYHHWIKERLTIVCEQLEREFPEHHFEIHTDSSPVLERDLAQKAGLGWFGKNTCLIHPEGGSLFFIGEILTSLEFSVKTQPVHDFCGTCRRCLEVCPTGALTEPRVLKSDLCISYWTIESRKIPPKELRPQIGDWLFGCDLCQTVCPWNQKAFKHQLQVDSLLKLTSEQRQTLVSELRTLLTSSHKQIEKRLKGTAMSRAGGKNLKRNALVVIANQGLTELKAQVELLKNEPTFSELAEWCLEKLNPKLF